MASSMIDAYSGAIATLGMGDLEIEDTMCVIAGISVELRNQELLAVIFTLLAMKERNVVFGARLKMSCSRVFTLLKVVRR